MDKRGLLISLMRGEITLSQFKDFVEIANFGGSVPLSYWVDKIDWDG